MKAFRKPRVIGVVPARMTSSRLPGKILKPILGKPALELMLERLSRVRGVSEIVVATTVNDTEQPVVDLCRRLGLRYYRGSELDVLGRIVETGQTFKADVMVEVTSDCIAIDPACVDQCLDSYFEGNVDYVSNSLVRTYPVGMDTHVFSTELLAESARLTQRPEEREHVGLFIYRQPQRYRLRTLAAPPDAVWPDLHLTLDTREDYAMLKALYEGLYPTRPRFTVAELVDFLKIHPEIVALNGSVPRNKSQSEYFSEITKSRPS